MFREGQYLEVIKASDDCLATAIVTVKERIIEIEKKKVSTNKWLTLQDWSSLYGIITKALLKSIKICSNDDNNIKSLERKKSTKRLDVIYKFEAGDESTLPTIKVRVCQAKKRTNEKIINKQNNDCGKKLIKNNNDNSELQVEKEMKEQKLLNHDEYKPLELTNEKNNNIKYIPSKKSLLETKNFNLNDKYTQKKIETKLINNDISYVPNIIKNSNKKIKNSHVVNKESNSTTSITSPSLHSISTQKKNKKFNIYKTTNDEYKPKLLNQSSDNNLSYTSNDLLIDEYIPSGGQSPNNGPSYVPNLISDLSNSNDEYIPTTDVKWLNKKTNNSQILKKRKKNIISETLNDLSNLNDEYTSKSVCKLSNDNDIQYVPDLSTIVKEKNKNNCDENLPDKLTNLNDEYIPKSLNKTTTDYNIVYEPNCLSNKKIKNKNNQEENLKIELLNINDEYIPTSDIKWIKNNNNNNNDDDEYSSLIKKRKNNNINKSNDDEYIPTLKCQKKLNEYSPNSKTDLTINYIPSLKNSNSNLIEEYEPNFQTNKIDFNLSYVPSSKKIDEYIPLKKKLRKAHEPKDSRLLLLKKKIF